MFDWELLRPDDKALARLMLGVLREPDLIIAPDGEPYLYRWHLIERNPKVNAYLHVQVASDPERPLHDHPWDNTSIILAGGYTELLQENSPGGFVRCHHRIMDDVITRNAEWAHRLLLPAYVPYTMTLFTTGPKYREWGFWIGAQWYPHYELIHLTEDGRSVFNMPGRHKDDN